MSNFELKDGQGTLFINDKKGNDKWPDRRGELKINGVVYEIAGWIKQGAKGQYLSISAQPKQDRQQSQPQRQVPQRNSYAARDDGFDHQEPPF